MTSTALSKDILDGTKYVDTNTDNKIRVVRCDFCPTLIGYVS